MQCSFQLLFFIKFIIKKSNSKLCKNVQVDFKAKISDVEEHFKGTGAIVRVTILTNKFTGKPKGFAYIEFDSAESADTALAMNGTLFFGRQIQVRCLVVCEKFSVNLLILKLVYCYLYLYLFIIYFKT